MGCAQQTHPCVCDLSLFFPASVLRPVEVLFDLDSVFSQFFSCSGTWVMNYASEVLEWAAEERLWEGKKLTCIEECLLYTRY